MALYRCMGKGGGSGAVLEKTQKLLTSTEELTTTGVSYTFTKAYKFVRVRITRNSTTTQGNPTILPSIASYETDNLSNGQSFSLAVSSSKTMVFYDLPQGAAITIKRSSSSGSAARYSSFDLDMYN